MKHRNILRRRARAGARGFTLVELVVVIGIIIALLSLVLAVSTLLIQQNESRQLEAAFANLSSAVQEYEQAVGRPIVFQARREFPLEGAYDIPNNPQFNGYQQIENYFGAGGGTIYFNQGISSGCTGSQPHGWEKYIVSLLGLLQRTQSAEDIVARIDPSLLQPVLKSNGQALNSDEDLPPLAKLVDPWGAAIAVVFPGRLWRPTDADGDVGNGEFAQDSDGTIRTEMEKMAGVCRNGKILFVSAGPDGLIGSRYCVDGNRREGVLDNIYSYDPETP